MTSNDSCDILVAKNVSTHSDEISDDDSQHDLSKQNSCSRFLRRKFLGFTYLSWIAYVPLTLSIAGLISSLTHYNECPALPSLWAFLLVFAITTLTSNTWKLVFKVPFRLFEPQEEIAVTTHEKVATMFFDPLFTGTSIWGAALTFPAASTYFADANELDCNEELFVTSFYVAAITIGITIALVISAVIYRGWKFCQLRTHKNSTARSDHDETRDHEISLTPVEMTK